LRFVNIFLFATRHKPIWDSYNIKVYVYWNKLINTILGFHSINLVGHIGFFSIPGTSLFHGRYIFVYIFYPNKIMMAIFHSLSNFFFTKAFNLKSYIISSTQIIKILMFCMTFKHVYESWSIFWIETILVKCQLSIKTESLKDRGLNLIHITFSYH
jgi:hypothetical protein